MQFHDPLGRGLEDPAHGDMAPRAHAAPFTHANNDAQAIQTWLRQHEDSPQTFAAYRKESERFLLWLASYADGTPLSDLTVEHIDAYKQFLGNPPPGWIGPSRPRSDPAWRPFRTPLSRSSIRYTMIVLREMMNFLVKIRYISASAFTVTKIKKAPHNKSSSFDHQITHQAWRILAETLQCMPRETPAQIDEAERARFVITWAEAMGGRASELAACTMADVRRRSAGDGHDQWWWDVEGKGRISAEIPVSDGAMAALMRYRLHLGLPSLPSLSESDIPLIWRIKRNSRAEHVNRSTIYRLTKRVFANASARAHDIDPDLAAVLSKASTHWLRHATATNFLRDGANPKEVQELMRHASLSTTMSYMHNEKDDLHERANRRSALDDQVGKSES